MSSDPEAELRAEAQKLREQNPDGALYDDELPEERENVSSAMKERLLREAGRGLDSNEKGPNVILYISIVVAVLVGLAGSGILY